MESIKRTAHSDYELECLVKKVVSLRVGELTAEFKSGCSVVDVLFPGNNTVEKGKFCCEKVQPAEVSRDICGPATVKIGEISFKNNYTAFLTVKTKLVDSKEEEVWKTCIKRMPLMVQPHCEMGSQDYFTVTSGQMVNRPARVMMLRLILQQPSPHWKSFGIEELRVVPCRSPLHSAAPSPLWLTLEEQKDASPLATQAGKSGPNVERVTTDLQQLWAMTEELKAAAPDVTMGRFDVEGCYDINLLSYT